MSIEFNHTTSFVIFSLRSYVRNSTLSFWLSGGVAGALFGHLSPVSHRNHAGVVWVMVTSLNVLGSLVMSVDGDRLDAVFIDDSGTVLDEFAIIKGVTIGVAEAESGRLDFGFFGGDPNPVRENATISYTLPETGAVEMSIYDIGGRLVRRLLRGDRPAGLHSVVWDGRNTHGRRVSPGAYFGVLRFGNESRTRKMILVR